jgi:hypothetical protein
MDHVLIDFLLKVAVGAIAALFVILAVGLGLPRRVPVFSRRRVKD